MEENVQTTTITTRQQPLNKTINAFKEVVQKSAKILIPLTLAFVKKLVSIAKVLRYQIAGLGLSRASRLSQNSQFASPFRRPLLNLRGKEKWILTVSAIALFIIVGLAFYFGLGRSDSSSVATYTDTRPEPSKAKARQVLNKEYSFSLKDDRGKEVSKVNYLLENAELQDSIIVKGQRAQAVKGRTFLIFNLKVVNEYSQGIEINTKDYIRLSVNGNDDWVAPEVHNDPVIVQAISTKPTRLGFPINDSDKDLTLRIGEIKGEKQTLKLELKPL